MMTSEATYPRRLAAADHRQARMFAFIGACVLLVMATALPLSPAWAGFIDDRIEDFFIPLVVTTFDWVDSLFHGLTSTTTLLADLQDKNTGWNDLLGGVYAMISTVQNTVIVPAAKQILTLAFMFRLLSIAKLAESNDMSPIATKVAMSCVGYFLMIFLVDNATAIITVGYDMMQHMLATLSDESLTQYSFKVSEEAIREAKIPVGSLIMMGIFGAIITALFMGAAYVVAIFMYYGKVLTLYFQAVFAPIPIALAGVDSTRQWSLGYIKNVAATLLSMVIMYINLKIYPLLFTLVATDLPNKAPDGAVGMLLLVGTSSVGSALIPLIALDLLLIFMLVKSSALAKEILGS